jgi:DNA-binding transcriptional LysR family regulator
MDYRLHVFRIVAEELNFTKAAKLLNISQPAVTRHIAQLEEHYSTPLFLRQKSGITLTAAGHKLLEYAVQIEHLDQQVTQTIRSRQHIISGTLRLAASLTVSECLLPGWLIESRRKYPGLRFSVTTGNTDEIIGSLLASKIDLGIIEGDCHRHDIKTEFIQQDEIICVAAANHQLARAGSLSLAQLKKWPLTVREPGSGTRQVVESALQKRGVKFRDLDLEFELNNSQAIKQIAISGHCLAFMPRATIHEELQNGKLVHIKIPQLKITRAFQFIYPAGPKPTGSVRAFMELVKNSRP